MEMVGVNCQGPSLWGSGQGTKRRQGPTHSGLLSSGAVPLCEALRRTTRGCQVRLPEALPAPRPPLSPAPYPGTAVKAWHAGDALVSLLSFLQEGRWVGSLPLDAVPAEALKREKDGQCGVGLRPGWARQENSPLNSARALSLGSPLPTLSFLPSHIPAAAFAPSSGDPIPALASSFLQKEALVGPSQSNFPDRRVGGGRGARRGTICPCCSCTLHPL